MDFILAWQNVIFIIPIILAFLFLIGTASGLSEIEFGGDVDMDADVDIDMDADVDIDHDHDIGDTGADVKSAVFDLLGFGKCPATIIIMTWLLLFGGTGLCTNIMVGTKVSIVSIITIIGSFIFATILTRFIASLVGRILPKSETYTISAYDLVEQRGEAISTISEKSGFASVRDHEGNLHQVKCRTPANSRHTIRRGQDVLVIDYDEDNGYTVITAEESI
jgi:membrane protein implicated in regulation of membrane protease activity